MLPGAVMPWGLLPWRVDKSLFFGDGVAAASLAALAQHRASCRTLIPLKIFPLSHQAQGVEGMEPSELLAVATRWHMKEPCMAQH